MSTTKPKTKKQKYYAIKKGIGVTDKIVTSWDECKKLVLGYPSVYKSFLTLVEAQAYLNNIKDVSKVLEHNKKAMEKSITRKKTTKPLSGIRIPSELFDDFEKKCSEFNLSKEIIIENLITEWVLD
ncbi:MAG: viroplasmin family protein [Sarcina sp.]